MRLNYNVTGQERKSLVGVLSKEINAPSQYLGAPTFQYQIGEYFIDKDGTVTGPDNLDLEDTLHQAGFDADGESRHYDEPDTYESGTQINAIPKPDELVIEMPLTGFTPEKLDNLTKIVTAKSALLKMALGAEELPIQHTGDTLKFPWFSGGLDGEHVNAYAMLIERLCITAKEKQRVTAKEKEIEGSPKYAMRCFLIALGFIGDEYKSARKILLSRFEGSSSYAKKTEETDDE